MKVEGRCYCSEIQYSAEGEIVFKGQCHCRECQYISGGNANVILGMPADNFTFSKGQPTKHTRDDLDSPVTRSFCPTCGTHLTSQVPGLENVVIIKVGTLDDPSIFDKADMAIWTSEKQHFHHIDDAIPSFERFPPQE